ncbi:hypothetical protein [Cloacibacterium sp.]|uniref:hypothetical protein n=1 Tax=Cloacibacterium sp. TaxID=1913682 RepID=UPI0035B4D5B6
MKKLVLFFSLLCFGLSFSQSNIEGIGIFKLRKTKVAVIDSLVQNGGYDLKVCDSPDKCNIEGVSSKKIFELKKQTKSETYYPLIDGHQVFVLSKYAVADFEIKELYLNFYNGVLYEIKTSNLTPLDEKLKLKYKNEIKVEEKEVKCTSVYGEIKRKEQTFTVTYRKDDIEAYSVLMSFFNYKCKEEYITLFVMYDKKINEEVRNKTKVVLDELKKSEQSKTKENLKDL